MTAVLLKLRHKTLYHAFEFWQRHAKYKASSRHIIRSSLIRMHKCTMLSAFLGWRDTITSFKNLEDIMKRIIVDMQQAALRRAFESWMAFTETRQKHK